jgi:ABC-type uncharacterized transport system permease subunit
VAEPAIAVGRSNAAAAIGEKHAANLLFVLPYFVILLVLLLVPLGLVVAGATSLHDADLKAANRRDAQDRIKPTTLTGISAEGGTITASLPPASWSVIRMAPAGAT